MMHGGYGDSGCVETEIRGQQLFDRGEDRDCVFGRGIGSAGLVRLNGRDQCNAQPGCFQLAVDAEVIAAKGAGPGNSNAQNG